MGHLIAIESGGRSATLAPRAIVPFVAFPSEERRRGHHPGETSRSAVVEATGAETRAARERPERAAVRLLEEERRRLARELHDEMGQVLTAVLYQVDACLAGLGPKVEEGSQLRLARETLVRAMRELRDLIYRLHPPILSELGLVPTLEWLARQFEAQYRITVTLEMPASCHLPAELETAVFRIAQEALTNVARHAHARTVFLRLETPPGHVRLVVRDDGRGFVPPHPPPAGVATLGLLGMRERVRQFDGQLTITSSPGQGTILEATLRTPVGDW